MIGYDSDEHLPAVAQRCKFLSIGRNPGGRMEAASEGISCNICNNWDGRKCIRNVFDTVLSNLDNI